MTFDLLNGLNVLDLGVFAAGPYCGKLLADAGAGVIHVERPGAGDPSRSCGPFAPDDIEHRLSATYAFLNAAKRSVTLDFTHPDGAALLWQLIDQADILIENFRPGTLARHGFSTDALLARRPDLVQVSISNYGQSGPYRDYAATEMSLQAMAGMMDGNGDQEREPLRYPGQTAQFMAGANAAHAALIAYRHAHRTGRGQQVDVSIQETVAATYYSLYADYQYTGALHARGQKDLYPTADGLLMARWLSSVPWEVFALAFDAPELAVDPALHPPMSLTTSSETMAEVISGHLRTMPRGHWFARAREHGITAGMMQSLDDIQACPHLAARSFYEELVSPSGTRTPYPGPPYTVNGLRAPTVRVAPRLGEHNGQDFGQRQRRSADERGDPLRHGRDLAEHPRLLPTPDSRLPLSGVRIVDNGIVQAGTFPARLLADFGAEVVRVENYLRPDLSRNVVFPDGTPGEQYWDNGGTYHEQHRNKDFCIGLDVRKAEAREAFLRLCMVSDVVLDSHPPGVVERLGLGHEDLRRMKPDLIVVTTSGYGHGGPYSSVRSFGMMTEIMCGLGWLNGYPGEAPRRGTFPFTDHETVYHIAFLILAALERRDRTGEGAWIDVSQYEVGINMLGDVHLARAMGVDLERTGNVDAGHPIAGCYRCRGSDAWITLSIRDRYAWAALAATIGRSDLAARFEPLNRSLSTDERARIDLAITDWTSARTPHECLTVLQGHGIAAGVVNDIRDLLLDPHLAERGFFWLVDHHPVQAAGRRAWPGGAARLSETPARLRRHAPLLGEHNGAVLGDLLGYNEDQYQTLVAEGAAGTIPLAAGVRPPARVTADRLQLSPWAYGRIKEYDADFKDRLTDRFGPGFGSAPELVAEQST
jgi:crotonobetainyl-CoA:carnitine CoA-transferase CaiB-like acyl-CoA transferase